MKISAILDTCLIDYSIKESTRVSAVGFLSALDATHSLSISIYTRFEIYRGSSMKTARLAADVLQGFGAVSIDKRTIDTASALFTCYQQDQDISKRIKSISDGDFIIGAVAFTSGARVITANRDDFPFPYFKEKKTHQLSQKSKTGTRLIEIAELEPNLPYLNQQIAVCYPKK